MSEPQTSLFGADLFGNPIAAPAHGPKLSEEFLLPPFSVLNAREGWWQERKRAWLGLGIKSEVGRAGGKGAWPVTGSAAGLTRQLNACQPDDELNGASVFDPVLCELAYRWFCPPGGLVLDPFAGGSVRGIVAHQLGRRYYGVELRPEQIESNREQAAAICGEAVTTDPGAMTPVERHGEVWLKRDDLFQVAGARGGKARTCWHLAQGAEGGLVTASSRHSPQAVIVAKVAEALGLPCRLHVPQGKATAELEAAEAAGAQVVRHKAGYNTVIVARAREDAEARGWRLIPFGMECAEAVEQTRRQVRNLPECRRLVVPAGSGMSLAGILAGLSKASLKIPVLAVVVGADPEKRLAKFAPMNFGHPVEFVAAGVDYHERIEASIGGVALDPVYEAKCARFLEPGDCLWVVGVRPSVAPVAGVDPPVWKRGDARNMAAYPGERADFVFTCPPYGDLERYSDDPADLSTMDYPQFYSGLGTALERAADRLKPNRFTCLVVGDFRDKAGILRGFPGDVVRLARKAGLRLYNEAILVTAVGSLPIRIGKQFRAGRKLGKTHQNVLLFVKGDPRRAADAAGGLDSPTLAR